MSNRTRLAVFSAVATLLASAALGAVFDSLAWLWPVFGVIAVVAGIGELGRRSGLPVFLTPVLAAVGVLGYVTVVFAGEPAIGRAIPGPAAFASLREQVTSGFSDMRLLAPPVPSHAGLLLITVVGVAAVAMVVDLLAVTLRRASLAGLPLLALFAVPAAVVPEGVGVLPFLLGGIGYLALLLADSRDRLARWGRSLGGRQAANAPTAYAFEYGDSSPLTVIGRRIGVAALGVALVVPALVPGLHPGLLGGGGNGLPVANGSNTVATYNPIVRLKGYLQAPNPRELMRLTTSDQNPGYLRMAALDLFDGSTWSESSLSVSKDTKISKGRLPAPDGLTTAASSKVDSTVKVGSSLDVHWLPVPFPATNVKVKSWNYDRPTDTIFSIRSSTRRMNYDVVSRRVSPSPEQLKNAPAPDSRLNPFLTLPDLPGQIGATVASITAGQPDAYSKAVAIQNYFRDFRYDLSVPAGNSDNDLVNFLEGRRGYCEQFAAAMAIFARVAQIPARVAIGFTRGQRQADGSWKITEADAHSWPELYFEGAGWLRFEPTPLGEGRADVPSYTGTAGTQTPQGGAGPSTGPGASSAPSGTNGVERKRDRLTDAEAATAPTPPTADRPGSTGPPLRLPLLGLLIVLLAVFPPLTRAAVRRRRWARTGTTVEHANAAWAELRDDAGDFGHPWSPSDSPRAAGSRLVHAAGLDGAAAEAVRLVVRAEEQARYARHPADVGDLRTAVLQVRAALSGRATRTRRWQARLLPVSSLRLAGSAVGAVGGVLDAADFAAARLRARLLPRRSTA